MSGDPNQNFLSDLLDSQRSLYAYLYKMTLDAALTQEVLQETNVVLMSKQDEYAQVNCFGAWAAKIAYFQLLAYRKRASRDRQRFSPQVVEMLADEGAAGLQPRDARLEALGECLGKLSPQDRDLIDHRYSRDLPSREIADAVQRSARAVSQALYRIRVALAECVRNRLASEEA